MSKEELNRTLAKLRADYVDQLPGTVGEMEVLWQGVVAGELPSSKLVDLARMAHSIAGSGTTFGLPDASRAARELETFLDKFGESGRMPGPAEQATVPALFAALRQAAARH